MISKKNSKALDDNMMITRVKIKMLCDLTRVCGFDKFLEILVNTVLRMHHVKNILNGAVNRTKRKKKG